MKRVLVVGGANGIGLSIARQLVLDPNCDRVYVVDKSPLAEEHMHEKIESFEFDLTSEDYSFFDRFTDIDGLVLTAGFGRLALFHDLDEKHIIDSFNVNAVANIRVLKKFYARMEEQRDFYCAVMVSIAGFMSSPFFSIYAATKAALKVFIESVNVELLKTGTSNRILNVSPGSIKGTAFYKGSTDLELTAPLAKEIIRRMQSKEDLFIPQYEEIYKNVLARYQTDFRAEGIHSYEYKEGQLSKR